MNLYVKFLLLRKEQTLSLGAEGFSDAKYIKIYKKLTINIY